MKTVTAMCRRQLLSGMVAAGAGLALSPRDLLAQQAAGGAPVKLTYWIENPAAPIVAAIKEHLIAGFERRYPNVKIDLAAYPGSDFHRILTTALAAGTGPDVFNEFGASYLPPAIDGGYVLPLDDAVHKYGWDKKIWKWALESGRYKGKLYSVPIAYQSVHLYYNRDLFDKNGWQPPTNWAELTALCKDMKDKQLIPFAFGARDRVSRWGWWLTYTFNAYAGNYLLWEVLSAKRPWTDPVIAEAINRLDQLWQAGYIMDKQTSALSHDDALGVWSNQHAVMLMDGSWRLSNAGTLAKSFKWDIAKLPMWREGIRWTVPIGIGEILAINAKTKNPEQALQFMDRFFRAPKELGQWMHKVVGLFIPPIDMKQEDFVKEAPAEFVNAHLELIESSRKGDFGFLMWTSWPARTAKFQVENIDAVLLRKMTIKEYLENSQEIFTRELKDGLVSRIPEPAR